MNNNLYKTLPYCDCWNSEINLMMSFIWKSNTHCLLMKCFPCSCNIDNCIAKWRLLSDTSRSFHYWLAASRWRQLPLLASLANPPKGSHVKWKNRNSSHWETAEQEGRKGVMKYMYKKCFHAQENVKFAWKISHSNKFTRFTVASLHLHV